MTKMYNKTSMNANKKEPKGIHWIRYLLFDGQWSDIVNANVHATLRVQNTEIHEREIRMDDKNFQKVWLFKRNDNSPSLYQ